MKMLHNSMKHKHFGLECTRDVGWQCPKCIYFTIYRGKLHKTSNDMKDIFMMARVKLTFGQVWLSSSYCENEYWFHQCGLKWIGIQECWKLWALAKCSRKFINTYKISNKVYAINDVQYTACACFEIAKASEHLFLQ